MEKKVLDHIFDRMRSRQTDDSDIDCIKSLLFSNLHWQTEKPTKPCVVLMKTDGRYSIWPANTDELLRVMKESIFADEYLILEDI